MLIKPLLLGLAFLAVMPEAAADTSHYKNILVGDRAATMGGTYVAISDDASGSYYNPAGLAYVSGTGVSASANVYHVQHAKYKQAIRSNDWDRHSAELIPNFFGLMKNWGDHTFAFSIVVPDSFLQHQDQIYINLPATSTQPAIDRYAFNLHSSDATYLIGPSYAHKISDQLSFGVTLNYFYRKNRMQNYQNIWITGGQTESSTIVMDWSEKGFAPKLGIKWTPLEQLSFGMTAYHAFILSSNFMSQITTKGRNDATSNFYEITSSTKRHTTTQISLGTAYRPNDSWLFAADVDFNIAPDVDAFSPNGYQGVINYSVGAEYKFNPKHAVRLGLFTNQSNSNEPDIDPDLTTHINMYGIATGYSFNFGTTAITVGLAYSFGSGKAQIYEDSFITVDMTRYSFTGIIATSFSF